MLCCRGTVIIAPCIECYTNRVPVSVRFGKNFARWEILTLIGLAHLSGLHWWQQGDFNAFTYPLIILPVGLWIVLGIFTLPPGPVYNRYLAFGGLHLLLFALLLSLGLASHAA